MKAVNSATADKQICLLFRQNCWVISCLHVTVCFTASALPACMPFWQCK